MPMPPHLANLIAQQYAARGLALPPHMASIVQGYPGNSSAPTANLGPDGKPLPDWMGARHSTPCHSTRFQRSSARCCLEGRRRLASRLQASTARQRRGSHKLIMFRATRRATPQCRALPRDDRHQCRAAPKQAQSGQMRRSAKPLNRVGVVATEGVTPESSRSSESSHEPAKSQDDPTDAFVDELT